MTDSEHPSQRRVGKVPLGLLHRSRKNGRSRGVRAGRCPLSHARERDMDALGLIVETDLRYPDRQGARMLIEHGINPIVWAE